MKHKVWFLHQHHAGGEPYLSLFGTEEEARNHLQEYVQEQWAESVACDDTPIPEDLNQAIDVYFEAVDEVEWYELHYQFVEFPHEPLPAGEIELTADELAITVAALGMVPYAGVSEKIHMGQQKVAYNIHTAITKLES